MIPRRKNSHKIGTFCASSKARPTQNLITIASVTSTRTSMTSKISWRMTLIVKKTNLKLWREKRISKGNESAYVGTNYKDEPTLNPETGKRPKSRFNHFLNKKNFTPTTNGSN